MKQAVDRCLRRRLGLVGPDELVGNLVGALVSCLVICLGSAMLYLAVIGRFFGRAARQGALSEDTSASLMDPTMVLGLALFFIVVLPFCAWWEGVDDPDRSDRLQGCSQVVTVYLGGSLLKALRALVPRPSVLNPHQFRLASALVAHLLENPGVASEQLAQGVLSGNAQLSRQDFDTVMDVLRQRNLVVGDPVKLEAAFKAQIRHAQG